MSDLVIRGIDMNEAGNQAGCPYCGNYNSHFLFPANPVGDDTVWYDYTPYDGYAHVRIPIVCEANHHHVYDLVIADRKGIIEVAVIYENRRSVNE